MTLSDEPSVISGLSPCPAEKSPPKGPYGVVASFAIGIAIWLISIFIDLVSVFVVGLFELAGNPGFNTSIFMKNPESLGLAMTLSTCVTMPLCVGLVVAMVALRGGPGVAEYLAAREVSLSAVGKWVGITFVLGVIFSEASKFADRPIPQFIIDAYEGAYFHPLLWVGLVVAAPVYEEVFFRGFLFEGILQSRLGSVGAVALTSLVWAGVHFQYEYFESGMLLVFGIVIGIARLRTRSILTCIAMHAFFNFMSSIETVMTLAALSKW